MFRNQRLASKFEWIQNLKLSHKFNLILTFIFLITIIISGAGLSSLLEQRAQQEVTSKADALLQTMIAVRNYTNERINPLLTPQIDTRQEFIPETVAAFSAITVFDNVRKNERYKDFNYREAALNPTNLRDKADRFETQLIDRFTQEPDNSQIADFRTFPAGEFFYIARRFTITDPTCLRCHSTPDKAPKSQLTNYGSENGFGWELDKTVFAQIIYVPASQVFDAARQFWLLVMGMLIAISALVVFVINLLLKRSVIKPITKMSKLAQAVSTGKADTDFEQKSNDEIGTLAASFNRMKSSLEIAMRLLDQKRQRNS
jgi:HAMP domain-containing protein